MKAIVFIFILLMFFSLNTKAQFKASQTQYLDAYQRLLNPSFDQGKSKWTNTNGVFSNQVAVPYSSQMARVVLTAETLNLEQDGITIRGGRGLASCMIKSDIAATFSTLADGSVEDSLNIISADTWNRYEIPFVPNSTDNGIRIAAASSTGTVEVDDCYLGESPIGYGNAISEAHFVGSLEWQTTTNCAWGNTSSAYSEFADDTDCDNNARLLTGAVTDPTSGLKPSIGIANARTDGVYKLTYAGQFHKASTNDNACRYRVVADSVDYNILTMYDQNANAATPILVWDVRFSSTGEQEIEFHVSSSNNSDTCQIFVSTGGLKISAEFIPDSSSVVVKQKGELPVIHYTGNGGEAITANTEDIPFATKVEDNFSAWDGDSFTPPPGEAGCYQIAGGIGLTAAATQVIKSYVDGVHRHDIGGKGSSNSAHFFNDFVCLAEGEEYSVRMSVGRTLNNTDTRHWISINKWANYADIIGKFKGKKCQTKYLTSDVTTDTADISDLEFTGLTIGESYEISGQVNMDIINGDAAAHFFITDDTDNVARYSGGNRGTGGTINSIGHLYGVFKAESTSLTSTTNDFSASTELNGNSTKGQTYLTLCKYPNEIIETTEW